MTGPRRGGHAVAASTQWIDDAGVRQPGGEVHAWRPGQNQTVCGLALSRSSLRRFPHVPFDFTATDVVGAGDDIGWICPRCTAATGGRRGRGWTRTAPRP
ncbi:hypothetical protein SAMN05444365_109108 [Micromonospora pattaloongensis]|uniref:Uncharacterized protein n=1 Tax=Micromonospora pattaloongensis TaxID=405436 RepID=A0A1H3RW95_9ACTN|nr:hypothetical protein [Micromonospora pattaloongensis]SDZ29531.1 hypothetical protein SAMN05444365_109108 [Micromonospora pattaloongensis]